MSRYISAELIKELMKRDRFMQGNAEWVMWQQEVDRRVDSMPSIEIVRCQDCKWYEKKYKRHGNCIVRPGGYNGVSDDDYCSTGKRKASNTDCA